MTKYRKKPVIIDAIHFLPDTVFPTGFGLTNYSVNADGTISIHTLEGDMLAGYGDWIIKGVKGEFYPCKNDIFEATYEKA